MNYWLTTHWPPRTDANPTDLDPGVWLPDGRESAGSDLEKGDKILIYQSRWARPEVRKRIDGTEFVVNSIQGKEGVIAVCEAESAIFESEGSEPSKYVDGSTIWWRWYAPATLLSKTGYVPREKLNSVLGYEPDYNLRGFGDLHSGLKKITAHEFTQLVELFKSSVELPQPNAAIKNMRCHGEGGESLEHFSLKMYVAANPSIVLKENDIQIVNIEYLYPTGDRADILLLDQFGRVIGLEIEVDVNDYQA